MPAATSAAAAAAAAAAATTVAAASRSRRPPSPRQVLKMTIAKYNQECRSIVRRRRRSSARIRLHGCRRRAPLAAPRHVPRTVTSQVMRYSGEWEKTVKRIGRWIEFETGHAARSQRSGGHQRGPAGRRLRRPRRRRRLPGAGRSQRGGWP